MPKKVEPSQIEEIVILGFERMDRFRKVTASMFKSYVPVYYQMEKGICSEPLNLVFNTIRAYVPNLVMQNPITQVKTPFKQYKQYAELLGLALDTTSRQIRLKDELRAWITNALFGWGIMLVGIKASGELLNFDDVLVDNGQVYARNISLSNFGFDPTCTNINRAKSLWHRTTVSRQLLLDVDGYDHDVVKNLPSSPSTMQNTLSEMTVSTKAKSAMVTLQDEVDVIEMYVPEVESIVTMGDPTQKRQGKYIRVAEANCPKEGPYVFLSFSPPVDENPFPVPPVSVWYELAKIANRVFVKMVNQFEDQKDVGLYSPTLVDTVDQIKEAVTGNWVPTMDPKGIQVVSFGGQNEKNERFMQELYTMYNLMSGNPELISGQGVQGGKSTTATAVQALQGNASIGIEDMRDILYDQTAEVQRRVAWHLHTDPFINLPLTKRETGGEEVELKLTPEDRMGDFLDYVFTIMARSMTKMDPMVRSKRIIEFCTNVIPASAQTALAMMQMGQQFNVMRYLTQIAFEMGISEIVEDMFEDPEFTQKMQFMLELGPQGAGKAGASVGGTAQNGGSPTQRTVMSPSQEFNQQSQSTAAIGQSVNQGAL